MRSDQRPDAGGPPTEITVGILIADVTAINDVEQTISGDFVVRMSWIDPRLADQAGCRFPLARVWEPRLELLNSSQLDAKRKFQRDQVEIKAGGRVHYHQRFFGAISTYHNLENFPFDPQTFSLQLTSSEYDAEEISFKIDNKFTRVANRTNIPDWTMGKTAAAVEEMDFAGLERTRPIFTLKIDASRNTSFYVYKVMVPLSLIVMMSWSVFWINPVQFGPQIGLSATAMLTLIAFQFALTGILPKLSYFTIMDKLLLGSTVLVFFSMVESVTTINLVSREREDLAVRLDKVCRWLFPLAFTLFWAAVIFLVA
ncbi:MAG: hypothetical protein ABFR97_05885 [Thermodesulfobacteriota bacterium]